METIINLKLVKIQRISNCGMFRPNWGIYKATPLPKAQEASQKKGKKGSETQRLWIPAAGECLLDTLWKLHPWSLNNTVAWTRPAEWHHQLTYQCRRERVHKAPIPRWRAAHNGCWEREHPLSPVPSSLKVPSDQGACTCTRKQYKMGWVGCMCECVNMYIWIYLTVVILEEVKNLKRAGEGTGVGL